MADASGVSATARVEVSWQDAEAHEARKERLVEARVLLEGHVLDDGRQLVVVADEDDALEARAAGGGVGVLQDHWDERLYLHDLRRLLHDERVVLEA